MRWRAASSSPTAATTRICVIALTSLGAVACGGGGDAGAVDDSSGGAASTTGGNEGAGGSVSAGGSPSTGGSASTGGSPSTGGSSAGGASGGGTSSGGGASSGGAAGSGGALFEPWPYPENDDDTFEAEVTARELYTTTPIGLSGRVVDPSGVPVGGASIELGGFVAVSDDEGMFLLDELPRKNDAISVVAGGYRQFLGHVHLARAVGLAEVTLAPLVLTPSDPGTVRMLFGGDVAFGRRFLDPTDSTPPDEVPSPSPAAWIDTSDPLPGTQAVMSHVQRLFLNADFRSVNLETPVTASPDTPHPTKDYVFFTLPGSLGVFPWLGVEYVALGNNHVYDYLEAGLEDTFAALADHGLDHSGAGLSPAEAFGPHRRTLAGHDYSFLSMNSVTGSQSLPLYVATSDPLKGGAADLTDTTSVSQAIEAEGALGRHPIVQLHTGVEYSYAPSDYASGRMQLAAEAGAALVVAHHPHVAQGFGRHEEVLLVQSLGNLAFDQARLETMLGLVAVVDMNGADVRRARGVPIFIEEYSPRPIVGALADTLVRRIAEVSRDGGSTVFAHQHEAWVAGSPAEVTTHERAVAIEVEVPGSGFAVIDLRRYEDEGESLKSAGTTTAGVTAHAGQDIWQHGDFEDWDVDDDLFEANQWELGGSSRYVCLDEPYRGAAALCSLRRSTNVTSSVTTFRNRVRILGDKTPSPNKDVTLFGYARGDNAGPVTFTVEYRASEGNLAFGTEVAYSDPGGTFPWRPFATDLSIPADLVDPEGDLNATDNPRALWLSLAHAPPASGTAISRFDELALITWLESADLSADPDSALALATPHPRQFLRIEAPPGLYTVNLLFERHAPAL